MKPAKRSSKAAATPVLYEVKRSKIQGKGVFAKGAIKKGACIVEYIGERISHREADRRYDDASMKRHHTFLFSVSSRTCIDGGRFGNDARYINHSCAPNCEAMQDGTRIFIHAKRSIAVGEELTYDYAYEVDDPNPSDYFCACGSPSCRGSILEKNLLKQVRKAQAAKLAQAKKATASKKVHAAKKSSQGKRRV